MSERWYVFFAALLFGGAALLGTHAAHGEPSAARPTRIDTSASARPASVVYPPSPSGLYMDHRSPAHRDLACERCHVDAANSTQAQHSLLPREASCVPCHAERIDRARPDPQCAFCHRGYDEKAQPAIASARAPAAHLTFSHARHGKAGIACARCHSRSEAAAHPKLPSMSECMQCHTGARALPCNGCHVALPSGRVRTSFPEGQLVPRSSFLGITHDRDFIVRHRWLAADESAACKSCHVEKDCSDCHDGQRRPRGIHPNDYLSLHAQDAERNATRCGSCHTTQSFCLPCHARLGIATIAAPDLAAPKRFHPPSAVWLRGPNQHAREAERSLTTCVSCHAERDCVRCHGSRGVGGAGLSPHPAGFKSDCRALLDNADRACRACHGDLDALRARCR